MTLATARWRTTLTYAPRLTLWDVGSRAFAPTQLQGGGARLEWLGRRARLSVDESASYGGVSFASSSLVPGPEGQPPRVDLIPTPRVIQYVSSTTALASRVTLRRWTVDTSLGYQLAGGANAEARALLPLQAGPFGEATVDYDAWHRDHVVTRLSASEAAFSSGPESILVEADEGWRHLWSRLTEVRLTLGISEARARASTVAATRFDTYPVVEAVFQRHASAGGRVDIAVSARLGPTVNRLIGLVDQRVQGAVAASHRYHRLTTRVLTSASQSVPATGVDATSLFAGELGIVYDATEAVSFDAGTRAFWQRLAATAVPFGQGTVFAGMSLRAPPARW